MTDKYAQDVLRREWAKKMPKLRFPPEWEVCIQPPWSLVDVRFVVWEGPHRVSVIFDADDLWAKTGEPVWKVYPGERGDQERAALDDVEDLMAVIRCSLAAQKAGRVTWSEE